MQTKQLQGMAGVEAFMYMLMLPHCFDSLDDRLKQMIVIYNLGKMIEDGRELLFATFENGELLGINFGEIVGDEFYNHTFVKRKVKDTRKLAKQAIKCLIENFPKVKTIVGLVPEYNRASQLYTRRAGLKLKGYEENYKHIRNGKFVPVLRFEYEV